jgi:predicted deacetylase
MKKQLVVSIHDVSPITRTDTAKILAEFAEIGISRTSLLVVPNHHHRGHFLGDTDFCAWLSAQCNSGHEAVMHGYFHQRARKNIESAKAKFVTRVYTADEGEFFDITKEAARELVEKERAEFARLGLHPTGFIAPAWLLSDDAEQALRELNVEYTTRLKTVSDFVTNKVHDSQSLCWSVRSAWRRVVSLRWNAFLFQKLHANPLLRMSIHPPDIRHPAIWRQIRALLARALAEREPMTYQRCVALRRDVVSP